MQYHGRNNQRRPETVIHEVEIYEFDDRFRLQSISHAMRGDYQRDDLWLLRDVVRTHFEGTRTSVSQIAEIEWRSVLRPSILSVLMVVPEPATGVLVALGMLALAGSRRRRS